MSQPIHFTIDGQRCEAQPGDKILQAARDNGIFIPTLCDYEGVKPVGSCRLCTVRVNGRLLTACTTPVAEGMEIENDNAEMNDLRKAVIELLFVEGNHFCPACEKSGNCELQALAYKYQMMVPRFPYQFNPREVDASHPNLIHDRNRCILCKRCVRLVLDEKGRQAFTFNKRGNKVTVVVDKELGAKMTPELAQYAANICPVGAILPKPSGFETPIGERRFDKEPIGLDNAKIDTHA